MRMRRDAEILEEFSSDFVHQLLKLWGNGQIEKCTELCWSTDLFGSHRTDDFPGPLRARLCESGYLVNFKSKTIWIWVCFGGPKVNSQCWCSTDGLPLILGFQCAEGVTFPLKIHTSWSFWWILRSWDVRTSKEGVDVLEALRNTKAGSAESGSDDFQKPTCLKRVKSEKQASSLEGPGSGRSEMLLEDQREGFLWLSRRLSLSPA